MITALYLDIFPDAGLFLPQKCNQLSRIFTALDDCGIDFSQFSMGKLADSTVDGTHYGIPFDNGATIMAIRSDMVEAAGLKVEDFADTTWSEFMELSKEGNGCKRCSHADLLRRF